eukprot:1195313-Prorocentrum_minimum.AAC.10
MGRPVSPPARGQPQEATKIVEHVQQSDAQMDQSFQPNPVSQVFMKLRKDYEIGWERSREGVHSWTRRAFRLRKTKKAKSADVDARFRAYRKKINLSQKALPLFNFYVPRCRPYSQGSQQRQQRQQSQLFRR